MCRPHTHTHTHTMLKPVFTRHTFVARPPSSSVTSETGSVLDPLWIHFLLFEGRGASRDRPTILRVTTPAVSGHKALSRASRLVLKTARGSGRPCSGLCPVSSLFKRSNTCLVTWSSQTAHFLPLSPSLSPACTHTHTSS